MTFDKKQRFSIRKYSVGVASVLLGTLAVGVRGNDHVQANEVESQDSGLETLAPAPDVVVEVTEATQGTETPTGVTLNANSEQEQLGSQVSTDQPVENQSSETSPVTTASSEGTQDYSAQSVASQTFLPKEKPADSISSSQENSDIEGNQPPVQSDLDSGSFESSGELLNRVTISPAVLTSESKAQTSKTSEGISTLTNAMAAGLVEMSRHGGRQSGATASDDLSLKLSAVTARGLLKGYFVDRDYIEKLKIGKDYNGMPWAYDFKVENPSYKNPLTGNTEPQIRYEAHVPMTRLGTIDFVDGNGQAIAGIIDKVTFENSSAQLTVGDHSYVAIDDAGLTKLPNLPFGYNFKYLDPKNKTKVQAYVDVLEATPQYAYTDSISQENLLDPDYVAPSPQILNSSVWSKGQKQVVTLIQQADGSFALNPSIKANGGKTLAPAYRYHLILEENTKEIQQSSRQTVVYQGAGDNTPATKVQEDFTFVGKENQVTGHKTWDQTSHTYSQEAVPVVLGYVADKAQAGGMTVTPDQAVVTDTVTYQALGKIIPVDESGQPIQGVITPSYANDNSDPTKAAETAVPFIVGYTASLASVLPSQPGQDTFVTYIKDDQKATVLYLDETTGQYLAEDHLSGKSGDMISYSTADKVAYYQDRGYALVKVDFPSTAHYDQDKTLDQVFTVTLKHDTVELGPNQPYPAGDLINPKDPASPKWPEKGLYEKQVTFTVTYVSTDQQGQLPTNQVQEAQWTRTLTLDKVTGQVLSATDWSSDKAKYDMVLSPVVSGYYVDKAVVASKTVTQDNLEETVTYIPLGRIIAVDEKGNSLPQVQGLRYNNDPNDPTKAAMTLVPEIPGYQAEKISVTPENPGQDSLIVYRPVAPSQPVVTSDDDYMIIIYRDEAGNQIRVPRLISSAQGRVYDNEEDRYINRNGVIYERIRQEGDVSKGRKTVTYIYRRVDNPSDQVLESASSRSGGSSSAQTSQSVQAVAANAEKESTYQTDHEQNQLPQAGEKETGFLGLLGLLLMVLSLIPGLSWLRKNKA